MDVLKYVWGRWTSLFVAPVYDHSQDNPIQLLASLNRRQWGYFLVNLHPITCMDLDLRLIERFRLACSPGRGTHSTFIL